MNSLSKLAIFLLLFTSIVFSQSTGRILGIVTHADTGDSLKDVNVSIIGSELATATNMKGAYLLDKVPPGISGRIDYFI